MSAPRFRTGVIGIGEQTWTNLLPSLAVLPEVEIAALCDTRAGALARASTKYRVQTYRDHAEMLTEADLDAVVIASTPGVHFEALRVSLAQGIASFVEKPPTESTRQLRELIDLNRGLDRPTPTQVGLNFGYSEPIRIARELMSEGEFGALQYVRITHLNDKPDGPLWFRDDHVRDFLLSQAIHAIAVAFDFGHPADSAENIQRFDNVNGVFFSMQKMFVGHETAIPFSVELVTSSTSPYFEWHLELISDNGSMIRINALHEVELFVRGRGVNLPVNPKWWRSTWRPSPVSSGHRRNGYQRQFEDFFGKIPSPQALPHRIEDCLPMYELMDRMEASHEFAVVA